MIRIPKRLILLLITLVFLYLVFINLDIKELISAIKEFKPSFIILLCISIVMGQFCRALCFKQLISKTVNAPLYELTPLCLTNGALNILLPARAGDFFRAFYVGNKYNVNKVKIFGSIILERIFDGIITLLFVFSAVILYNKNQLAVNICYITGSVFLGSLFLAFLAIKFNKTDAVFNFLKNKTRFFPDKIKNIFDSFLHFFNKVCNSFIDGFEILKFPGKLFFILLSSFSIWFFEGLNYFIIIQGINCHVSWSVILFIIGFIAVACVIPSTSIFIGPYQFAVISAFAIYNISKETALAVTFIDQAAVTIVSSIVALIFLLKFFQHILL